MRRFSFLGLKGEGGWGFWRWFVVDAGGRTVTMPCYVITWSDERDVNHGVV